jgi:hypothetical protein
VEAIKIKNVEAEKNVEKNAEAVADMRGYAVVK